MCSLDPQGLSNGSFGLGEINSCIFALLENTAQIGVGGVSPLSVDGSGAVTEEAIQRTIDQLEDDLQKDFIRK